jgi:sulfate/thiosulfate transport system permease protein
MMEAFLIKSRLPNPLLKMASFKQFSVLPAFKTTLLFTCLYLGVIVLFPLGVLLAKTTHLSLGEFWHTVTESRVLHAFLVSFEASFIAACINAIFGFMTAWVLVRYDFPYKRVMDALIDLPFALPTAVAGIAFSTLYASNGWLGQFLEPLGFKVAYSFTGIVVVLVFVGLPFVVRTLQPVLEDMDQAVEDAARVFGATPWQTFTRVLLPPLLPSLLTGFGLAWARGLGEYGSVIFIAGNLPHVSEIIPLLIVMKLEQYQTLQAAALAVAMLGISFLLFFILNLVQKKLHHQAEG